MKETKTCYKNVADVMQGKQHDLHFILTKVNKLREIENKLSLFLDKKHAKKVKVANVEGPQLTLLAVNAAEATQIRYQITTLLTKFSQEPTLRHIKEIKCIVSPHQLKYDEKDAPTAQKLSISVESAKAISEIANSINDQNLRNSLERIAQHTSEKD